jgi:hypothetical protein
MRDRLRDAIAAVRHYTTGTRRGRHRRVVNDPVRRGPYRSSRDTATRVLKAEDERLLGLRR